MIYFDMTSCLDYIGRNPLGIVRVEMNFVQYGLRHLSPREITFCYYDRTFLRMGYLTFSDAQGVLNQIGRPTSQPAAPAQPIEPPPAVNAIPLKRRVKEFLKACRDAGYVLCRNSPKMTSFLQRCERKVKTVRRGRGESAVPSEVPVSESFTLNWTSADTFVTVGLIWDYLPLDEIYAWKKRLGFKMVGMIYDLVPYRVPEYCLGVPPAFFRKVADLIWCADAIATISECTRADVEAFIEKYQLPRPAVMDVTHLGMDVGTLQDGYVPVLPELDVSRLTPGRFILQVGTIEPRKNHALTLLAWRLLAKDPFPELMPLVVVGAQAWGVGDVMEMARRDRALSPKYLIHSNRVSDQTLLWLYKNCFMTVYPSFYEGWGLPVSESLAHGKFCLTGDNGALVEAGAGLAEHLSPFDAIGWARRLKELMTHPETVEAANRRIKAEYRGLSWEQSACGFYELVKRVGGEA